MDNFRTLLEIQRSLKAVSDLYNTPYFRETIKAMETYRTLVNSPFFSQLSASMKTYKMISQAISPAQLQQIQLQYDLLEKYNIPASYTSMRVQNEQMAKDYFVDIVNDVNWETMEQDGVKVEAPIEMANAIKSEAPSIKGQSDLTESDDEETSIKDTLAIICYFITICRFVADIANYVSQETNREKAYALYCYLKDHLADFFNQMP